MAASKNPAAAASEMQNRTRKEKKFDEFEASLPDPKSPKYEVARASQSGLGSIFKRIGDLNPFGKAVTKDDTVWLLDNTAFRSSRFQPWQAEYVAAVFERDPYCKVADVVSNIAHSVGLADDAAERDTIEERILPFLWDIRMVRIVKLENQGKVVKMTPTNINGISTEVLKVPSADAGRIIKTSAVVPRGANGLLEAKTVYAGPEGWGIISDIDDTIKVTLTSDPTGIVETTFADEPTPVSGMPELYAQIKSHLPEDTPWFYLSASPYNLYPFLRQFREQYFPHGTLILRDFSWKTISGLLSALTVGTEEYKTDRMKKINSWLPQRKMVAIGDSTQSDPEAYGEIYRLFPGWVKLILIRKVEDVAAVGLEEKNEPQRFEAAFEGIPREAWHVFTDPSECLQIIKDAVAKED
uniref:Phosphatidate phosphatase APP1 catalytic domain-containing protein n=1 Tax=Bionectria ochroleuca TaxID=29856 RepID=A0A8H7NLX6_BIOOC